MIPNTPSDEINAVVTYAEGAVSGADEGSVEAPNTEIFLDKTDRSLAELFRWWTEKRLIVDPEWQREEVWDDQRKSRLIESFLKDIPVPVVYLAKTDDRKYEVIDGKQRLTSVFNFLQRDGDKKLRLKGLEILRDLEGKTFDDLPEDLQNKLRDTPLRTFELAATTPTELKFVIFERLNTGGKPLNEMELRNCLFRGPLNDLIKELAKLPDFVEVLSYKNMDKRLTDRSMVLRFLAFHERTHLKCTKGLKSFLNEFFRTYQNAYPEKLEEFRRAFAKAMRASKTVFGDRGFRLLKENHDEGFTGDWTKQPNAAVFQAVATSFENYSLDQITRRADAINEAYVDLISTDRTWVDSVTRATADQSSIKRAFEVWRDRLRDAVGDEKANDSRRLFSLELKKQLFDQSKSCRLCGQEIKLLTDAALDHDVHYWRGGRTVPENARLVHRLCNLKRSRTAQS